LGTTPAEVYVATAAYATTATPIRLKELRRQQERIRTLKEHLNSQPQTIGGSAFNMDPKTAKVKELFEMFGLNRFN
jgi:hypothetical protein